MKIREKKARRGDWARIALVAFAAALGPLASYAQDVCVTSRRVVCGECGSPGISKVPSVTFDSSTDAACVIDSVVWNVGASHAIGSNPCTGITCQPSFFACTGWGSDEITCTASAGHDLVVGKSMQVYTSDDVPGFYWDSGQTVSVHVRCSGKSLTLNGPYTNFYPYVTYKTSYVSEVQLCGSMSTPPPRLTLNRSSWDFGHVTDFRYKIPTGTDVPPYYYYPALLTGEVCISNEGDKDVVWGARFVNQVGGHFFWNRYDPIGAMAPVIYAHTQLCALQDIVFYQGPEMVPLVPVGTPSSADLEIFDMGDPAMATLATLRLTGNLASEPSPPSCALTAVIAGPPRQLQITVQDTGSGLGKIEVTESKNASTPVPSFTVGTIAPVVVTATKIDKDQGSQVALRVTDVAGNVTVCDPVIAGETPEAYATGCSQGPAGPLALLGLAAMALLRRRRVR
jgi:MYXO-CTERM domain-containing protein